MTYATILGQNQIVKERIDMKFAILILSILSMNLFGHTPMQTVYEVPSIDYRIDI